MLAPDGRCKTLDASADGYGRAEAVGAVHMRVASSLESTGMGADPAVPEPGVSALILGAAINQDGRSSSLTAPNGPAQQALIRTALATAHLPPGKVRLPVPARHPQHIYHGLGGTPECPDLEKQSVNWNHVLPVHTRPWSGCCRTQAWLEQGLWGWRVKEAVCCR